MSEPESPEAAPGSAVGVSVGVNHRALVQIRIQQLEPAAGIEPVTCCLQNSCSAVELRRRGGR